MAPADATCYLRPSGVETESARGFNVAGYRNCGLLEFWLIQAGHKGEHVSFLVAGIDPASHCRIGVLHRQQCLRVEQVFSTDGFALIEGFRLPTDRSFRSGMS